jgi:hypothetical protein
VPRSHRSGPPPASRPDDSGQAVDGEFPVPADVAAFVRALRAVKLAAGDPSLETLRRRTGVPTSTLSDIPDAWTEAWPGCGPRAMKQVAESSAPLEWCYRLLQTKLIPIATISSE